MRRTYLFGLSLLLAIQASGADRVALVIGNNDYTAEGNFPDLNNCRNDAALVKDSLERAGFTVIHLEDADWQRMDEGLANFENAISKGGTAVFYFAGHGIEFEGKNYLMGTNARLQARSRLGQEGYDAETVAQAMLLAGAGSSFLFLDCCREVPGDAAWLSRGTKKRGLADLKIVGDILICFAATPGQAALDAPAETVTGVSRENSPYAQALAKAMHSGLDHLAMFQQVRSEVNVLTSGQQRTWESGSFLESFYFTRGSGTGQAKPGPPLTTAKRVQVDPGFGVGGRVQTSYG
ncbi:MAG: caspase family protein, partial [Verrucomicrobiales bacterium]